MTTRLLLRQLADRNDGEGTGMTRVDLLDLPAGRQAQGINTGWLKQSAFQTVRPTIHFVNRLGE